MPLFPDASGHAAPLVPDQSVWAFDVLRRLAAVGGSAVVAAEFAVAPVTLCVSVLLVAVARMGRWHPSWLALPASIGLGWAAVAGPLRSAAGFVAGAAHLVAYLASSGSLAAHLARLSAVGWSWRAALAGQMPIALAMAAAQAYLVDVVRGRFWPASRRGHGGRYRPGLGCFARRAYVTATLARGELATIDGACIGIEQETGRGVTVSWAEAAGGVLVTGDDLAAVTRIGLDLAVAAIQHRKAVIVVDLTGDDSSVERAIAVACSDQVAPLRMLPKASGPAGAARVVPTSSLGLEGVLAGREVLLAQPSAPGFLEQVSAELVEALAGRRALGVPADGVAWFNGFDEGDRQILDQLAALTSHLDLPLVLGTASGEAAARLAHQTGVVVVRGRPPRDLSERPERTGAEQPPALPAVLVAGRLDDDLSLLVRGSAPRLVVGCRTVRRRRDEGGDRT